GIERGIIMTTATFPLEQIQAALHEENVDGWLLYDFHGSNRIASKIARLSDKITTRRWYYFIPSNGIATKAVHAIEQHNLDHLPGEKIIFRTWEELHEALQSLLGDAKTIVMEYSPENDIPYVSLVDAGTIELVRECGVTVKSSADLVQLFEARWDDRQTATHFKAASMIDQVKDAGFRFIGDSIRGGKRVTEYDAQQYMWRLFEEQ